MRIGSIVVAASVALGVGCERGPSPSAAPEVGPVVSGPPASQKLRGSWRTEGFVGSNPAGSASAAALNAGLGSEAAQKLVITYTGDQVKIAMPSGQLLTSSYAVLEDGPSVVKIQNGPDLVVITFTDADHMIVDRPNSAYFAKMKLRRVVDAGT